MVDFRDVDAANRAIRKKGKKNDVEPTMFLAISPKALFKASLKVSPSITINATESDPAVAIRKMRKAITRKMGAGRLNMVIYLPLAANCVRWLRPCTRLSPSRQI